MYKVIIFSFTAIYIILINVLYAEPTIHKCKTEQGDFRYQRAPCAENNQTVATWTSIGSPAPVISEEQSLNIIQDSNGHYVLNGKINDNDLTFVVDTGASLVALPSSLYFADKLECRGYVMMDTANGQLRVRSVTLNALQIGTFLFKDVAAVLMPNLSQPLLGMNILQQFIIEQHDGQLRLSKRN